MSTTTETREAPPEPSVRSGSGALHVMQVMYFFLACFVGAVALFVWKLPPIFPAILIGVSIGFVTFYALGGIETATKFSLGPVNVSGSLAAIAAATFGINFLLSNQIIDPDNPFPGAQWLAVTSDLSPVESVQIGTWGTMPSPRVNLNSATPLILEKNRYDYQVSRSDIAIGTVARDQIDDLVDINFPDSKFKTVKTEELHPGMREDLNKGGLDFPFYLETGAFDATSYYTLRDKVTDDTLHSSNLWKSEYEIVMIKGKTYFIANAHVDHTKDMVLPYDTSYVQFLIGELTPKKTF